MHYPPHALTKFLFNNYPLTFQDDLDSQAAAFHLHQTSPNFTKLHQTSPNFTKIAQADCFALGQLGQLGPQRAGCDHGSNAWGNSVDWIEIAGIITKDFAGHFRSRNVSKCLEDSWRLADLRDSPNWKNIPSHPKSRRNGWNRKAFQLEKKTSICLGLDLFVSWAHVGGLLNHQYLVYDPYDPYDQYDPWSIISMSLNHIKRHFVCPLDIISKLDIHVGCLTALVSRNVGRTMSSSPSKCGVNMGKRIPPRVMTGGWLMDVNGIVWPTESLADVAPPCSTCGCARCAHASVSSERKRWTDHWMFPRKHQETLGTTIPQYPQLCNLRDLIDLFIQMDGTYGNEAVIRHFLIIRVDANASTASLAKNISHVLHTYTQMSRSYCGSSVF